MRELPKSNLEEERGSFSLYERRRESSGQEGRRSVDVDVTRRTLFLAFSFNHAQGCKGNQEPTLVRVTDRPLKPKLSSRTFGTVREPRLTRE